MSLTDQIMFDHVQPVVFIDMLLYRLGFSNQKVSSFIPPTAKKRTEFYCIPNVLIVCKYQDKSTNIRVSDAYNIAFSTLLFGDFFFVLCFIYLSTSWQDQQGNVDLVKLIIILFFFLCKSVQVWVQRSIMAHYTYEVHKCECKSLYPQMHWYSSDQRQHLVGCLGKGRWGDSLDPSLHQWRYSHGWCSVKRCCSDLF